jgi:nicotinic acid mononucleotide adenylyltransferase
VRYVWIMGADNLATFDRWQRWREIFTMVPIVVVDRPGWRLKALASKAARAFAAARLPETEAAGLALRPAPAWTFLTGPLSHVSSDRPQEQGAPPQRARCQKGTQGERRALEKPRRCRGRVDNRPRPKALETGGP